MKAIGYVRVSTDKQADGGSSLEAQRDTLTRYCESTGWTLAETFEDAGVSGRAKLHKRPGLLDAIGELKRGDVLVVAKRDRLSRSPMVALMVEQMLEKKGCRVVSAAGEGTDDDDPTSVLMRRMLDAFAEFEGLSAALRTKTVLRHKKRNKQRTGGIPYGYVLVEKTEVVSKSGRPAQLTEEPAQQRVLVKVRRWRKDGATMRAIANRLTSEGIPTSTGKGRWSHSSVQRILERTKNEPE